LTNPELLAGLAENANHEVGRLEALSIELRNGGALQKQIDALRRVITQHQKKANKTPRHPRGTAYRANEEGLFWLKPTQNGSAPVQLTNFKATILTDTCMDDGVEVTRSFGIAVALAGRPFSFVVRGEHFGAMNWVTDQLGASAIVYPGFKDHARAAIQSLSPEIEPRRVYTHTGWRKIDGSWLYLHAGGAIGRRRVGSRRSSRRFRTRSRRYGSPSHGKFVARRDRSTGHGHLPS